MEGSIPVVSSSGPTATHNVSKVPGPGVVTGRYGTIGSVFYVTEDFWPLNTTLYVKDFKGNDPRFVSYFLRTVDYSMFSDKAAVPGVNRNHLHKLRVRLPPPEDQPSIGRALGALDDKIELNQRMNQTLEETARGIFKSWFVDFDPVRGTATVPDDILLLFPERLVDSSIGPIPEGWAVAPLGEQVDVTRGLSYTGDGLADEGMPLHNLNSVLEGGGYKYDGIKYYTGEYRARDIVQPGDVIVANTEQGFEHLLIGYPAIVPRLFGEETLYSQDLSRLRPAEGSPFTSRCIYLLLVGFRMHHTVAGYSNGTTVNHLHTDGLRKPLVAVPPAAVVARFDDIVRPVFDEQEALVDEAQTLAGLRDSLLPKLISGEVRVRPQPPGAR